MSATYGGLQGFKAIVAKLNKAGIKAGIHTMSAIIDKKDRYVTPTPDPRLLKTSTHTLAGDIGPDDSWLPLHQQPSDLPGFGAFSTSGGGYDIQIDEEIITYAAAVNLTRPFGLARCSRGAYGTVRAAHKANATVSHLIGIYGGFLPDPRTDLIDEVMANVASVYNEAGLDM